MQRRLAFGVTLLGVMAQAAAPAQACNEWSARIEIVAATPDGGYLRVERYVGGFGERRSIVAVDAHNQDVAACETGDMEGPWRCRGDARLRARGSERTARVLERWRQILGAEPPRWAPLAAPVGVTAAMCSRFGIYLGHDPTSCGATDTELLELAGSPLVFAHTRMSAPSCGAEDSYDGVRSMTRDALRARLVQRAGVFDRRSGPRAAAHARDARAALAWLDAAPAPPAVSRRP